MEFFKVFPWTSWKTSLTEEQRDGLYERFLETLDASYYARRDMNLGKVLGWAEKNVEAAQAFERALESMATEPELLRNLGIVYQKQHKYELAIEKYLALLRLRPHDAEVHFNLGKCYQGLDAWTKAVQSFEKALELTPGEGLGAGPGDGPNEGPGYGPNEGKTHYNLALSLRALGRYQEERHELEAAWKADPGIPGIAALLGSVYAREGRLDDAIRLYQENLEQHPDAPEVYRALARAYETGGDTERAREAFHNAVELAPEDPWVHFDLGDFYARQEKLEEAIGAYRSAVDADPRFIRGYRKMGEAYGKSGRLSEAIEAFVTALEIEPDGPNVGATHYHLGSLYSARAEPGRALEHFRRAKELGIDVPAVIFEELGAVAK